MQKTAILIPVYNEEKYIGRFITDLSAHLSSSFDVIFIDDGSNDKTRQILEGFSKQKSFRIISHKHNKGKGAAMRTGLQYAKKKKYLAVIFMDGDMQHNPKYLQKFKSKLETCDLVFGYRKLTKDAPYIRKLGNVVVKIVLRLFFNIKRNDILCGYMAIGSKYFDKIAWKSDDYGVETEISAIVGKKNLPFEQILIDTIYLDKHKGVTFLHAFFIALKIPIWYLQY